MKLLFTRSEEQILQDHSSRTRFVKVRCALYEHEHVLARRFHGTAYLAIKSMTEPQKLRFHEVHLDLQQGWQLIACKRNSVTAELLVPFLDQGVEMSISL